MLCCHAHRGADVGSDDQVVWPCIQYDTACCLVCLGGPLQDYSHSQLSHCVMKQLVLPASSCIDLSPLRVHPRPKLLNFSCMAPTCVACRSNPSAPSYWLPVAPQGYGALGHVVSLGFDPPAEPVQVRHSVHQCPHWLVEPSMLLQWAPCCVHRLA